MIATRFMELRKRRGLMAALILVNIGIPVVFLTFRLLAHAIAPHSYGPAGGYEIFSSMVAGVLFVFGFIVAATLGCTAGSVDLTEGMFRHLVVTGRSRLALYLARIPAGLAIIVPMVAVGFTIVCTVCVLAAPTHLVYDGVTVPPGLSHAAFDSWASDHAEEVVCNFNINIGPNDPNASTIMEVLNNVPCENRPGGPVKVGPGDPDTATTDAGPDRDGGTPHGQSELRRLLGPVHLAVDLAHDQVRTVDRALRRRRLPGRPRPRPPSWASARSRSSC